MGVFFSIFSVFVFVFDVLCCPNSRKLYLIYIGSGSNRDFGHFRRNWTQHRHRCQKGRERRKEENLFNQLEKDKEEEKEEEGKSSKGKVKSKPSRKAESRSKPEAVVKEEKTEDAEEERKRKMLERARALSRKIAGLSAVAESGINAAADADKNATAANRDGGEKVKEENQESRMREEKLSLNLKKC